MIEVDHVFLGADLDGTDWDAPGLTPGAIGTLSASGELGLRSLDVTAAVAADASAGRLRSEFRLRFPLITNGDGRDDGVNFEDAGDDLGTGNVPMLVVRYLD